MALQRRGGGEATFTHAALERFAGAEGVKKKKEKKNSHESDSEKSVTKSNLKDLNWMSQIKNCIQRTAFKCE